MIVTPDKMDFSNKHIIMVIYGAPGTGKSTLACSAPNPLVIDTDNGTVRVNPAHRVDTSICRTYEEIQADIEAAKGKYEALCFDTGGAFIRFIKEWVKRHEKSALQASGSFTQKGYGFVRDEFWDFSEDIVKDFHIVYIFHEEVEKRKEDIRYNISCEGSSKTIVWNAADIGGRLFIRDGKRYLGLTPTDEYDAKHPDYISGLIEVPELKEGDENNFLTLLFEKIKKARADSAKSYNADKAKYDAAMKRGMDAINSIDKPELIEPCVEEIKLIDHALTSKKELQAALKKRLDELFVYDKETKSYKGKE